MMSERTACVMGFVPECGEPLDGFLRSLHAAQGLDLSAYDAGYLHKALDRGALASGCKTVAAYAGHLVEHRTEAEAFARSLRISHSGFFRHPQTFALLEGMILPGLLAAKRQAGRNSLRLWSAACAAGQEVWSLAILLDDLTRAGNPPQAYRIFGSDLSEAELALACAGVYSAEAVGNVRLHQLSECFVRHGEGFEIAPRLRTQVDFSVFDLLDASASSPSASIYGDFDLVLCCNLLFYYRPAAQQRILDKLCRALASGGYLVTGEAERDSVAKQAGLRPVQAHSAVFQAQTPGLI
jgi:chemotaxis methyl-accepting protein methylase